MNGRRQSTPPAGNLTDKYTTRNPVARRLVEGFLRAHKELLETTSGPRRILDIGCAEGYLLERLHRIHPRTELLAMDLNLPMAREAAVYCPQARILVADAELLPLRSERFDLVGKPVLAIGGRLHEQKGVVQLFRMLSLVRKGFPDVRLLVMGHRAVYDGGFAAKAVELGVDELVVPTDWLNGDDLQCAYAATDVFVTPSICFDTFGLVNLEAMEHGKPVVATAFGGSREVVEHGVTGYVENPIDVEQYAARPTELLGDPELRARMGARGRARVREYFTIERLTAEYLEEYRRALEAVGKAAPRADERPERDQGPGRVQTGPEPGR